MSELQRIYEEHRDRPDSDIKEYMDMLFEVSKECYHITEMGVREVNTTWAFLYGLFLSEKQPKRLVSYDLYYHPNIELASKIAIESGVDFEFIKGNTGEVVIEHTNLLFIDTEHTYQHLMKELRLHSDRVSNYIFVHDTSGVYGTKEDWPFDHSRRGELASFPEKYGMWAGCQDFVKENPEWEIVMRYTDGNGMTILGRTK